MTAASLLHPVLALLLAPLLPGIINRTKAVLAGRDGQPLLQAYFDLAKLLRKGSVFSRTTTWVFAAGPVAGLAAALATLALLPLGGLPAPLSFRGDLILFAYLLAMARFFTVLAALDTGSSFEGMGGSREVLFSALAEPAFLLGLAALARLTGSLSLTEIVGRISAETWRSGAPVLALVASALGVVYLAENARIPVDDPNTHLELTMIHEVMVLDHSGPGLAFITYASALKLWILGSVLAGLLVPVRSGHWWIDAPCALLGLAALAVLVGIIESTRARLRLRAVPHLLVGAGALSALAVILLLG